MGKFIVRQVRSGYKFDLLAGNGQEIATGEVYETVAACKKGIQSVRNCVPKAKVADLTEEGKLPANPKFEVFVDKAGFYRFRLKARNGQVVAVSENYSTKAACLGGIESVKENAPEGEIVYQ